MASNYIQKGDTVTVTAPYNVVSGAGVQVGKLFGIGATTFASGARGEIHRTGVFRLNKLATDVVAEGVSLYWDNTNKRLTVTASTHLLVGNALEAVGNPSADVLIVLTPVGT